MGIFGHSACEAFRRAADRARPLLRIGDRVTLGSSCGGGRQTVTFSHWSNGWGEADASAISFSSRSLDDLSPWNIVKVNGAPVSFRDDDGERAVQADRERFAQAAAYRAASAVQQKRNNFRLVVSADSKEG